MLQLRSGVSATRRRGPSFHVTLSWLVALTLGGGCGKPLTDSECVQLLDQYVELLLESDNPGTTAQERLKLKQEARAKARRDPAFAKCSSRVSRSQFECAMKAHNPDGLEQCLL